jgi:hypothetical protein
MANTMTRKEYLAFIADRIVSERPSAGIILNTMISIEEKGYGRGYNARVSDSRKFRDRQTERRTLSWNTIKDMISDNCSKATIESTNQEKE